MEQVFRIEIPVEAVDKSDTAALQQLESTLQKIFTAMKQGKTAASDVFDAVSRGASEAKAAMKQVETATDSTADSLSEAGSAASDAGDKQEQAASGAEAAAEKLDSAVSEVSETYKETGSAATEAGRKSGSAFNQATSSADRFTQRIEKSEKTLRSMFKEKLQLIISAIDKASPVLKSVWNTTKSLAGKAWNVAVRMKDFVTAPFRKLYNMVTSPITLALSVAGIGFSASEAISTFNEFETGMSAVKSLTGATGEEFLMLKQTAKDLGAETAFSASEASQGMQYLAMAGWDTNQIIAAMPGLLDLAAAGSTELGTAADIVANVMTAMGMAAGEASRAADVFAKTATSSNTTIETLGETLKYAAPIAHSFGLSLEEVSALAGMMGNAGIKGSMAGTAIRSSLMSMAAPSKDAATLMKKLKLSFSEADGSMKDMKVIVRDLQKAFSGLTEQQKLNYTETLFGTYASSAWLGVIDQGADTFDSFQESLEGSAGAAQEMAKIRLDNLAGDMEELGGAVETAKLELMEKLDPYMRKAVQWLTGKIPQIQAALEGAVDKAIEKVTRLKNHLSSVFDSSEFKNADGFAEKLFIAWDKIIAEPFAKWWNGDGQGQVLGVVEKIGQNMGKVLHGIIAGIFAAIKGEEIDFDGLNLTGIAKAGAETAKTFVSSFMEAFDLGGLAGKMPGFLKAGLFGLGAIKLGQGAYGITKTIKTLKEAFGGVATTAATAKVATAAVGQTAATSAVGIGKAGAVLGGLKTVLAAIPVWGWVAAAAIAATAVGIKMYTDAQERNRQELLHMGDSVEQAADNYRSSARQINEVTGTIESIREVEIKIKRGGLTTAETTALQAELAEIESRKVWLEAQLADETLTPEQIAIYQAELDKLQGREVELSAQLAANRVTAKEVNAYASELAVLQSREEEINMALEKGVTGEQAQAYMQELEIIQSRKETITLALEGLGVTTAGIAFATALVGAIDGKTAEVKVIMGESSLTAKEINEYTTELAGIYTREAELDLQLTGASLTTEQVAAYKDSLAGIQNRTAEIEAKIAQGGLTAEEIATLSDEYETLKTKEATISLLLSGQGLTQEQLGALMEEWEALDSREAEITAKMAEGGMSEQEIADVAGLMKEIGDKTALLNVSFATGSLDEAAIAGFNAELDSLYEKIAPFINDQYGIDLTADDLKTGAYDSLIDTLGTTVLRNQQEAALNNLEASTIAAKTLIPELKSDAESSQQKITSLQAENAGLVESMGMHATFTSEVERLGSEYELNKAGYLSGTVSEDQNTAFWDSYRQQLYDAFLPVMKETRPDLQDWQYQDWYSSIVDTTSLTPHDALLDVFGGAVQGDYSQIEQNNAQIGQYQSDLNTAHDSLSSIYEGEMRLATGRAFLGTEFSEMPLEEIAKNYTALDEAGRKMFEDAVLALDALNAQTDYIGEGEKAQAVDVVELAAKAQVMATVQEQVQTIASNYATMTEEQKTTFAASEEGAEALQSVNSALESLGLDKIESLDQLNTALETLSSVDLSTFSLADVQAAFVSLGGDATGCKTDVDALRNSLKALDGTTATATINQVTNRVTNYSTNGSIPRNASGGIYDGAFVSLVAEDGPEAIIPLGAKRRNRGIDLWLQAGEMLGVTEFAEGGILAPYAGATESIPDDVWDDDGDGDGKPKPISTGNSGGGGHTFAISVAADPTYEIHGNDSSEDIIDKLKAKQKELAELMAGAFAEELEDIVSNMV